MSDDLAREPRPIISPDIVDQLNRGFDSWKDMAKLQLEYMEKLGEYRLNVARAEVEEAKAANLLQEARLKARTVDRLERELRRLDSQRQQVERRIHRYEEAGKRASMIRRADQLDPDLVPQVWIGFNVFLKEAPHTLLEELVQIHLDAAALASGNFSYPREPDKTCEPAPPGNVLQLCDWLRRKNYMPRFGTLTWLKVNETFEKLAGVGITACEKLREAMGRLEDRTFDRWMPVMLTGFPQR